MVANENLIVLKNTVKKQNTTDNHKLDNYLDDYCNYAKEYKMHYQKSNNGSQISLSLYPYMQQKWESLKKLICKAYKNNLLNEKQIERLVDMKIIKG